MIGVNSQIETGGSGSEGNIGIGFAIPIDTAKKVIPQIERHGTIEVPYLGVTSETIDDTLSSLNLPVKYGVLVQTVTPGTGAARAGLRRG